MESAKSMSIRNVETTLATSQGRDRKAYQKPCHLSPLTYDGANSFFLAGGDILLGQSPNVAYK